MTVIPFRCFNFPCRRRTEESPSTPPSSYPTETR
jgi:hypothetical protein